MRTLDDAREQFAYHPATEETAPKHDAVRRLFLEVVERLWPLVPDGPEKTLAIRDLQRAQMNANLAVALLAPAVEPGKVLRFHEVTPGDRLVPADFRCSEEDCRPGRGGQHDVERQS